MDSVRGVNSVSGDPRSLSNDKNRVLVCVCMHTCVSLNLHACVCWCVYDREGALGDELLTNPLIKAQKSIQCTITRTRNAPEANFRRVGFSSFGDCSGHTLPLKLS